MKTSTTIQNKFGEKIHIKIENDRVWVHHEDASETFITLDELFMDVVLGLDELALIHDTIKTLSMDIYKHLNTILNKTI